MGYANAIGAERRERTRIKRYLYLMITSANYYLDMVGCLFYVFLMLQVSFHDMFLFYNALTTRTPRLDASQKRHRIANSQEFTLRVSVIRM